MNNKHNIEKKPELSGTSAQVLAALRAEKLPRTPSTIIKRLRADKALAASRMATQVALDKLEARAHAARFVSLRAAGLAEDRAVSLHAADLLDHARDNGSTLERALEDFQGEAELLGELGDLVLSRAYDIDAEVE